MRTSRRPPAPLTEEAARERCLRLLDRRGRSAAELGQRLRAAGAEQGIIDLVLADLKNVGLVDDEEFARLWVAERRSAGLSGRQKLRWELRRKGISEDLIRRTVDEAIDDESELAQALGLARRRLGEQPAARPALARLRRFLLGRGFGFGTVETVMRRVSHQGEDNGLDG